MSEPFTVDQLRRIVARRRALYNDRSVVVYLYGPQMDALRMDAEKLYGAGVYNDRVLTLTTCNGPVRVICEAEFDSRSDAQIAAGGP